MYLLFNFINFFFFIEINNFLLIGDEYNEINGPSNKKSSKSSNNKLNEKLTRPSSFTSQNSPPIIPNQQSNHMSNIQYTQTIAATAPDESVLHHSVPIEPYTQQFDQSSPQNYVNSNGIEAVPQNSSTVRCSVDEPPPSYESIMKE